MGVQGCGEGLAPGAAVTLSGAVREPVVCSVDTGLLSLSVSLRSPPHALWRTAVSKDPQPQQSPGSLPWVWLSGGDLRNRAVTGPWTSLSESEVCIHVGA